MEQNDHMSIDVMVDLEEEVFERLIILAAQTGQTPADFMATAIVNHVQARERAARLERSSHAGDRPGMPTSSLDRKRGLDE